jgi:hypothetical protein
LGKNREAFFQRNVIFSIAFDEILNEKWGGDKLNSIDIHYCICTYYSLLYCQMTMHTWGLLLPSCSAGIKNVEQLADSTCSCNLVAILIFTRGHKINGEE